MMYKVNSGPTEGTRTAFCVKLFAEKQVHSLEDLQSSDKAGLRIDYELYSTIEPLS